MEGVPALVGFVELDDVELVIVEFELVIDVLPMVILE